MNDLPGRIDLIDLRRQLSDLAESVDAETPWDDPLPYVRHHAFADRAAVDRAAVDRAAEDRAAEDRTDTGLAKTGRAVPRIARRRFDLARLPLVPIASVAAAVLAVVGLGLLVHGGSDSKKATSTNSQAAGGGSPAAAAGTTSGTAGTSASAAPQASAGCSTPRASARVVLSAPADLASGVVVQVRVATSGVRLSGPTIVVRSGPLVVGRLVTTSVTRSPGVSGRRAPAADVLIITGRLVRSASPCLEPPGSTVPAPAPVALPAGHYQLVVVGTTGAGPAASAPVAVTIHR